MAGFLERMGLVKSDEPDPIVTATIVAEEESEECVDKFEVDATKVAYDHIINSIYDQGAINNDNSIFKIQEYINILPSEMTNVKKQASIAGILNVNGVHISKLIEDGLVRTGLLNGAEASIKAENDTIISEAEEDIEKLKTLIEAAEAKIAEAKKKTADATTVIHEELEVINGLLEFAEGIVKQTEEGNK